MASAPADDIPDSPARDGNLNSNNLELQETKELQASDDLPGAHLVQSHVERPQNALHEIAFVAVLCCSQLMTQAGLAVSVAPLRIIGNSFGTADPGQRSWMPAAYSLAVGTFILIAGRLGDLYGHKRFIIAGFAWYALWCLLAGFSTHVNIIFFDCCRAFQGIGPAFLLPNSIAILGRAYKPGLRKAIIFSLFGATAPSGFVIGAIFSTLLTQKLAWPWAYWIMAIALFVLAVLGYFFIPHTPPPVLDDSESAFTRIDIWGSITGVSGLVLINFAWNQAPIAGWSNPYVYVLLIVGFIFMGVFAYVESRIAKFPLIPHEVMTADTGFLLSCVALGWASFGIWLYYFWQFLEGLRNITPFHASLQFIPCIVSGFCAAIVTGLVLGRIPGSSIMLIALLSFTTGLILLVTAPVGQTYWAQTFVSTIIMPWGMCVYPCPPILKPTDRYRDMSFPAATLLLSNLMAKEHQGVAGSLVNTVVNYSISIALGIAGTVEAHSNSDGNNLLEGYRSVWYLGIGLSGSGAICAVIFGIDTWRNSRRSGGKEP
jgi:MFS family permease